MRLLIAEDEIELNNALTAILKHDCYVIDSVFNGEDALYYASSQDYDGIILDIMMPKKSGIEVLNELRKNGNTTPILILTAKTQTEDKILGLDAGADDYLTKPFDMREFLARVRAVTRRKSEIAPKILVYSNISLNRESFSLCCGNEAIRLSNKEFQMLLTLIENQGRLLSADRLMEQIWGYDSDSEINVVWVYISYLRKKLASIGAKVAIKAVRGIGYTLEESND